MDDEYCGVSTSPHSGLMFGNFLDKKKKKNHVIDKKGQTSKETTIFQMFGS